MTSKKKTSSKVLTELNRRLKEFNELIAQTRNQIKTAREIGPAYEGELKERLSQSEIAITLVRKKLTASKSHCKKRKQEIDEWKLWYNGHAAIDKSAELVQLNEEISWRAVDIAAKEAEISALYIDLVQAEGENEAVKIEMMAFEQMDFEGEIDDDLRIQTLLKEKAKVKAKIAKLK